MPQGQWISRQVRGLTFATLDAICRYLDCAPADILEFVPDGEADQAPTPQVRQAS